MEPVWRSMWRKGSIWVFMLTLPAVAKDSLMA